MCQGREELGSPNPTLGPAVHLGLTGCPLSLPQPGPWGHGDWGGTMECSWHVLTGDFMPQLGWEEAAGQRPGAGDLGRQPGEAGSGFLGH